MSELGFIERICAKELFGRDSLLERQNGCLKQNISRSKRRWGRSDVFQRYDANPTKEMNSHTTSFIPEMTTEKNLCETLSWDFWSNVYISDSLGLTHLHWLLDRSALCYIVALTSLKSASLCSTFSLFSLQWASCEYDIIMLISNTYTSLLYCYPTSYKMAKVL